MPIKLIAFDMDGTLLNNDHVTVPEENISALRAAREKGIKLVAATGRTWCMIQGIVELLGGVDYAVISNGAAVLEEPSHRWLYHRLIPNDKALEMIAFLKDMGEIFEVYCQGQNYMENRCVAMLPQDFLSQSFASYYEQVVVLSDDIGEKLAGRDVEKVDIFRVPPERRARICGGFRAILPDAVESNMEFTAGGVTKGVGLKKLCQELGIAADEVMAFGDGLNDVEMLEWAGLSFAMANGSDAAKAAAKGAAPANILGGVGLMVRKYILEKE